MEPRRVRINVRSLCMREDSIVRPALLAAIAFVIRPPSRGAIGLTTPRSCDAACGS